MEIFGKTLAVFDIEANGLSPTKIHCLTAAIYSKGQWRLKSTTDPSEIKKFFKSYDIYVGHNIQRWDIPVINRLIFSEVETEKGYRIAVEEGLIKRGDECVDATLIDTLGLSWYLFPDMLRHGLEDWGEFFGVPKPKIDDWENLTTEEYIHRCEEDVKINCKLWDKQLSYLLLLYDDSEEEVFRLIKYLEFKLDCAREAEFSRWRLDINRCKKSLKELKLKKAEKNEELKSIMPFVEKTSTMERPESLYKKGKTYKKPKTFTKKDGSLSVSGEKFVGYCKMVGVNYKEVDEVYVPSKELTVQGIKWMELLEGYGLPETHEEPLEYISSVKEPNPNSHTQMKDYLFSLGWKPETYNKVKKKNEEGDEYIDEIPQLRVEVGGEKQLCPSVKKLFKVEPKLEALEGLSIITHRMGILKGYLNAVDEDGYVKAEIQGFTNTLRFKHKTVVNLPSIKKPYGDVVRGVLIADEGHELCGSDMSSLEDRTKQHYMWDYDPEYVKKMMSPDFDPHIDIAIKAGFISQDEGDFYKWWKKVSDGKEPHTDCKQEYKDLSEDDKNKEFKRIDKERAKGKTTNYAATYGAGGAKIAESADLPKEEGYKLHESYWDINWSITAISKDQIVKVLYYQGDTLTYKTYKGEDLIIDYKNDSRQEKNAKYARIDDIESMWLYNPVSKFWYSLRYPKDIFSTLNQGTGVYCFDMWIYNFRQKRPQITGQFHDEVILHLLKGNRKACEKLLKTSVRKVNKQLSLNRDLDVDVNFGNSYAEIH